MRRLLIAGSWILGAVLIATVFAAVRMNAFLHTPVAANEEGAVFEIESGASFRSVSDELAARSIIGHPVMFRAYARWVGRASEIQAGDYIWKGPVTLAAISNGPWIGGMFHIAPQADNNDGQLDLLIVGPVSRLRITSLVPKLVRGSHMAEAEITHVGVKKLSIEASTAMPSHLDGEVGEPGTRFDVDILPGALELL